MLGDPAIGVAPTEDFQNHSEAFKELARFDKLHASTVGLDEWGKPAFVERLVAVDMLRIFLACRIPVTLWGPVGARKTRTIEALCREKGPNGVNYQVLTITPSTQDSAIINGIFYTAPDGDTVVMRRSMPDVAKQIIDYYNETGGYTIVFVDEITTCMVAQQNAILGLLTHGKFDQLDVSDFTAFAIAGNPPGTVSVVNPLGEAVINRGGHIAWFGDLDVFLDDWTSGFHGAMEEPDPDTQWYIKEYLRLSPSEAFRSKGWRPQDLIPWDSMEHTERSTTNLADVITFINAEFPSDTPFQNSIRQQYIIEATKALQGEEWAGRMARVIAIENSSISAESIIEKVREAGINKSSELPDVEALFDTLHVNRSGSPLNQAAYIEAASSLLNSINIGGHFSTENYIAFWAFTLSSRDSSYMMGALDQILEVITIGNAADIPADVKRPKFLTGDKLRMFMELKKARSRREP